MGLSTALQLSMFSNISLPLFFTHQLLCGVHRMIAEVGYSYQQGWWKGFPSFETSKRQSYNQTVVLIWSVLGDRSIAARIVCGCLNQVEQICLGRTYILYLSSLSIYIYLQDCGACPTPICEITPVCIFLRKRPVFQILESLITIRHYETFLPEFPRT
jgi:hypothetical protein